MLRLTCFLALATAVGSLASAVPAGVWLFEGTVEERVWGPTGPWPATVTIIDEGIARALFTTAEPMWLYQTALLPFWAGSTAAFTATGDAAHGWHGKAVLSSVCTGTIRVGPPSDGGRQLVVSTYGLVNSCDGQWEGMMRDFGLEGPGPSASGGFSSWR